MRRANGEGTIFKEASGRYRIAITKTVRGKPKRVTRTAWKQADALAILRELKSSDAPQSYTDCGAFLTDWLRGVEANLEPNTFNSYSNMTTRFWMPRLTGPIESISPSVINRILLDMLDEGVPSSIRMTAHTVGRVAFTAAVRMSLIASNPFSGVRSPKHEPKEILPFNLEETFKILNSVKGTRYYAMIFAAFCGGMRENELWGVTPDRIDLTAGTIRVDRQLVPTGPIAWKKLKSKASLRTVNLTPDCAADLRDHLKAFPHELAFTTSTGKPIRRPNFMVRIWYPLLDALDIVRRGFHHTRHTYATLALGAMIPIQVVSRQLGHKRIAITYNTYCHVIKDHETESVKKMQELLKIR